MNRASGLRAVAIDDHDLALMVLQSRLEEAGFEVTNAEATFAGGVEAITVTRPDLIVVDYRLNDGFTGLDVLEHSPEPLRSHTVVMSSSYETQVAQDAWDGGAGRFLLKSCSVEEFQQVLYDVARGIRSRAQHG